MDRVRGEALAPVERVAVAQRPSDVPPTATWTLLGVPSYERYVRRAEQETLQSVSAELGRPQASSAALIPIVKSAEWWRLASDERREIFEERSHHIAVGLRYVPAIARRLYHCHDADEPFDFLTWFEFAPDDVSPFEQLVSTLRRTEEWAFVEREIDIRLTRA